MKNASRWWWIVRISWPLLGGAWGAWLGFGGYLRLPANADSFALPLALGFFGALAWTGLFAGMVSAALIGGLLETLLRRAGLPVLGAVTLATLACVLALWQIGIWLHTSFPGLSPPAARPPLSAPDPRPRENPCAQPPPEDSRQRSMWDAECR